MEPLMAEEKQQSRQASLTLQVMNGNELESGRAAKCLFSENGGIAQSGASGCPARRRPA